MDYSTMNQGRLLRETLSLTLEGRLSDLIMMWSSYLDTHRPLNMDLLLSLSLLFTKRMVCYDIYLTSIN
jgi:hypothetical protein